MENVPKIVTERLKAATAVLDHPNADLLAAFAERALPDRERSHILEHLARCSECRDVVALALPAEEPAAPLSARARGGLLSWPRLRWAVVAAGVLVVGSFGVMRYRASSHPATVARYNAPQSEVADKEAKNQELPVIALPDKSISDEKKLETAPASSVVANKKADESSAPKQFDRLEQFAKLQAPPRDQGIGNGMGSAPSRVRTQSLAHGPRLTQQWQQNSAVNVNNNADAFQFQAAAPAAPPVAGQQQASNEAAARGLVATPAPAGAAIGGPLDAQKKQDQNLQLAANNRSVAPLSLNPGTEVARAKPAETPSANAPAASADGYGVSAGSGSNFSVAGSLVPESARWSISATGGLQRSMDQGRSWQEVDVDGAAGSANGLDLQRAMKTRRSKAVNKDKEAAKAAPIVFRAVSANGPDVWAGGSEGSLYHSTDSGSHWIRIVPSWRGIELTGDIVNLQFADAQHGRIITSTAEIWMTADAGQTWDKQ